MERLLCRGVKSTIDDKHLFFLVAILNRRDHLRTRWTRQLGDKTPLALLGDEIKRIHILRRNNIDLHAISSSRAHHHRLWQRWKPLRIECGPRESDFATEGQSERIGKRRLTVSSARAEDKALLVDFNHTLDALGDWVRDWVRQIADIPPLSIQFANSYVRAIHLLPVLEIAAARDDKPPVG